MIVIPTWSEEKKLWEQGYKLICGVDEVGRGPLAGPVVAGAVVFRSDIQFEVTICDSKMLTRKKREELFPQIQSLVYSYGVGLVEADEVDSLGIVNATHKAMREAIKKLKVKPNFVLVDGREKISRFNKNSQKSIIKGDQKSYSIAAASILAKVYRDRLMLKYHEEFPVYGFDTHVGYGTKKHLENILKYGLCRLHRRSFLKNYV
ncbi:ribonuclease HII [candidate division CPR3 bacterium GWF2_35_18]|nr:MAG: ribonuclease HII [candidate division CPR3 bacterium GWF2_35_18]OGB64897.1 MAG: ribonuclease HII [candidate division CPR3 bacterium RIFOXYA2_FULL_35_13]OGB79174.1 MAG: ribonuclease HII [candidate division CPR3 bacterium RIFOXYB2_FULL_35_8]OGB80310.1 MAG: ribonuclease HII [candidate division CPR3 bacterium GWE2_35_7]